MSNDCGWVPEDSIEAAIARNYAIDLDVCLLADGNLVVFHGEHLGRLTGVDQWIRDQTLTSLRFLRLLGTDQAIPLLAEVLNLIEGRVSLLIDLRSTGQVDPTAATLDILLVSPASGSLLYQGHE